MQMPASVTALKIAMVHWCARLTDLEELSYGKGGEDDPDEIRFALVRSMSNSVGRPARCALRACRRARRCAGDPPDCWRGEPEPCEEEFALSRAIMHRLRALWHAERETPPGSGREGEGMSPRLLRKRAQERNNQSPAAAVTPSFQQEIAMAKGQMRSNKEKKKPKADKNKKAKSALAPSSSPFANAQSQGKPGANPYGKKGP